MWRHRGVSLCSFPPRPWGGCAEMVQSWVRGRGSHGTHRPVSAAVLSEVTVHSSHVAVSYQHFLTLNVCTFSFFFWTVSLRCVRYTGFFLFLFSHLLFFVVFIKFFKAFGLPTSDWKHPAPNPSIISPCPYEISPFTLVKRIKMICKYSMETPA